MRKTGTLCLIALLTFLIAMLPQTVFAADPFELHLLDVGQGQCVLVEAEGHYMLVDGGGRAASSFVVSYLKEQGIDSLDVVAVSHYDEDHMAGIIGVLSVFPVGRLILPAYEEEGDLYESFAEAALSNGCTIEHGRAGQTLMLGSASAEIVGPVSDLYEGENDRSLVLRILYGEISALITGDAEQQSELDMVQSGEILSSLIYVAGHHGSSSSSTDAFLDAVAPGYVLISCGRDNGYGHPAMETLQRIQNRGIQMFRTDLQGTILISSDGKDIWFNTAPCEDWSSGNGPDHVDAEEDPQTDAGQSQSAETGESSADMEEETTFRYVCNTSTKKFHDPGCSSVAQMNEKNKLYTNLEREQLLAEGYEPCGNCRP